MASTVEFSTLVFSRGFILSQISPADLGAKLLGKRNAANLNGWTKTFFGPCTLWVDPKMNYARVADGMHGVGLMGLCLNPFDGALGNEAIAERLHERLKISRESFFDYVDELSGSFVIIYRENTDVYLLQDTAATRPVYYNRDIDGNLTSSSHITLLSYVHDLEPDPRSSAVYSNEDYKADPSRYLPGMITAYKGALPLTANNQLSVKTGNSQRFFPREALAPRDFGPEIIGEIADIMVRQARMLGALGRPMMLAATGGRDSRVSASTFSGVPGVSYFSFHRPSTGRLTEDTLIAKKLAEADGVPLSIFDLEKYNDRSFAAELRIHSPLPIWPEAAMCYLEEFSSETIHIRSTVSEIGRVFYRRRIATRVTAAGLAQIYTSSKYSADQLVIDTMQDFIDQTSFDTDNFFNYDLHDMFYWEHRNAKWQNILCAEAEMATDVFIPFNNRNLLKLFMSVPYEHRLRADIHFGIWKLLTPKFAAIEIA